MAGLLRKSMLYLGLVDDEAEYADHDDADHDPAPRGRREPVEERAAAVRTAAPRAADTRGSQGAARRTAVSAVAVDHGYGYDGEDGDAGDPAPGRSAGDRLARITTLHPRTYNDARTIGEQFRAGVPVIINLTDMADADAKRLVDFAAGLTFGLRGRIEKVTRSVFLLSPEGIAVQLDDAAGVVEGGFYNQS